MRGDNTIDLVVTDYAMPAMNGVDLAKQLRLIRPGLPVLLVTGFADALDLGDLAIPHLTKPYSQQQIADLITGADLERDAKDRPPSSARRG